MKKFRAEYWFVGPGYHNLNEELYFTLKIEGYDLEDAEARLSTLDVLDAHGKPLKCCYIEEVAE